ncbi:unnamed protein product [Candida verbasci]|uniref:Phosphotransferase n=1 Tax=Candida verbasci TaxID=1227364 RepID=A0A9W4TTQ8_9ASCO|nr:unnamed protein product [Candida verbasci]
MLNIIQTVNLQNDNASNKSIIDNLDLEDLSPPSDISLETESSILPNILSSFTENLNDLNITKHSDFLLKDFKSSLKNNSKITMLTNYPIEPTGDEFGKYLVIDLGGSTLRIAVVNIDDDLNKSRQDRVSVVVEKKWIIENNFKTIDYNFFKFIGEKIEQTLKEQDLIELDSVIKTGITWSFPLETTNYNNGKICHVSKGYTIDEEIYNKDLKDVLESVLKDNFNIQIDIESILNDSLAVYSAGCFIDDHMKLAMVLGTGFNMCCSLNKNENIHDDKILSNVNLFNTELSLFGTSLIKDVATKYDSIIDNRFSQATLNFKTYMEADPSNSKLFQPNELMTSGRYLPELTRLILLDLIENEEIFTNINKEQLHEVLSKEYDESFDGEIVCFISETEDLNEIISKFKDLYSWDILKSDILIIKEVLNVIIKRAAFIVATSIIGFFKLINDNNEEKIENNNITIGYVGSVLNYFHNYRILILDYVNNNEEIKKMGITIDLKLIENSSIIGAAIGAAYYSK